MRAFGAAFGASRGLLRAPYGPRGRCRRTHPAAPINRRRAIHRLDSANNVSTCAVFFFNPR